MLQSNTIVALTVIIGCMPSLRIIVSTNDRDNHWVSLPLNISDHKCPTLPISDMTLSEAYREIHLKLFSWKRKTHINNKTAYVLL